jgi:hypothetical protein
MFLDNIVLLTHMYTEPNCLKFTNINPERWKMKKNMSTFDDFVSKSTHFLPFFFRNSAKTNIRWNKTRMGRILS